MSYFWILAVCLKQCSQNLQVTGYLLVAELLSVMVVLKLLLVVQLTIDGEK